MLTDTLKEKTWTYHKQAEKTAFMARFLRGNISRKDYTVYLNALKYIYQALENKAQFFASDTIINIFAHPALYRKHKIEEDLSHLDFLDAEKDIIDLGYIDEINAIDGGSKLKLIGHFYVRFFGDLNGGLVLLSLLKRKYHFSEEQLHFYDFAGLGSKKEFLNTLRRQLNDNITKPSQIHTVVDAAISGFKKNIALLNKVTDACFGKTYN